MRTRNEKWNPFEELTQLWDPVDDTDEEGVLSGDVVAEVDILGGSEDPVQWVCLSVNFWAEFLIDQLDQKQIVALTSMQH